MRVCSIGLGKNYLEKLKNGIFFFEFCSLYFSSTENNFAKLYIFNKRTTTTDKIDFLT